MNSASASWEFISINLNPSTLDLDLDVVGTLSWLLTLLCTLTALPPLVGTLMSYSLLQPILGKFPYSLEDLSEFNRAMRAAAAFYQS